MLFNATFNNTFCISVISWRSALLVKEIQVHRENHRHAASHWQTLSHKIRHGRGRMVVRFISIYAISACCEFDFLRNPSQSNTM